MNLPQFTAEASLLTTTRHHQLMSNQFSEAGKQGVSPQLTMSDVPRFDPRIWSYCWERRCFWESHVGRICLWVNRC
jgi:hypothetical protein